VRANRTGPIPSGRRWRVGRGRPERQASCNAGPDRVVAVWVRPHLIALLSVTNAGRWAADRSSADAAFTAAGAVLIIARPLAVRAGDWPHSDALW